MALDRIIMEEAAEGKSPPTLRFLQFDPPAALVGYHQDVDLEIRADYCRANGVDINRRLTGGGSILFQESALGWELFGIPGKEPFAGSFETILHRICSTAAAAMSELGLDARFRPRNDIEVNGRKISGTGGVTISGGFMFQGTILIENEIELFLKALRVPVEKLKKREIESLMERICFLNDLIQPPPRLDIIKQSLVSAFSREYSIQFETGGLTPDEQSRLREEIGYYQSEKWIMSRSRPAKEGEPLRAITQTDSGTLRVHLWLAPGARHVRQALIAGDFFAVPDRLIHDLEASLVGVKVDRQALNSAVRSFLEHYDGHILGISSEQAAEAVACTADRLKLVNDRFSLAEANELFLLNTSPKDLETCRAQWLLLPYCSKQPACEFRKIPGCSECGDCEISDCFALADVFGMEPLTIQSFEHLMEILTAKCSGKNTLYIGSCCEAFYAKHQKEMVGTGARGVLVNLDSTTCYDLGKGTNAYKGDFENKTSLNLNLISKLVKHVNTSNA